MVTGEIGTLYSDGLSTNLAPPAGTLFLFGTRTRGPASLALCL
jgi:hypothetical protein